MKSLESFENHVAGKVTENTELLEQDLLDLNSLRDRVGRLSGLFLGTTLDAAETMTMKPAELQQTQVEIHALQEEIVGLTDEEQMLKRRMAEILKRIEAIEAIFPTYPEHN